MALVKVKVQDLKTGEWKYVELEEKDINKINKINEELLDYNQISSFIDNLDVKPELKAILDSLKDFSLKIGNLILNIGRKILEIIIYLYHNFPNTFFGTIVGAFIGMLISSIPILGWALGWLIVPLTTALGAWSGLQIDLQEKKMKNKINQMINEQFDVLKGLKIDEN